MKITKPKNNQILLEDDALEGFEIEVKSKTGLNKSEFNDVYEGYIFAYRKPGMDASKQIMMGNESSISTLFASTIENFFNYTDLTIDDFDYLVSEVRKNIKKGEENE